MKKTTLIGFWLVIAALSFWWGTHHGHGLALREMTDDPDTRVAGPVKLLDDSGRTSGNADGIAQSSDRGANESKVDEVMAEAMALDLEGLNPSGMAEAFNLFRKLDERDLPAALEQVEDLEGAQTKALLRKGLLSRWAEFEVTGPGDYVLSNSGNDAEGMDQRRSDLREIISIWSERNPEGALEWLESRADEVEDGGLNDRSYLSTIFKALSEQNANQAFSKLKTLKGDQARVFALSGMMQGASNSQRRGELMEKLDTFLGLNNRDQGYQTLISQWANLNPEEAAAFVNDASHLKVGTTEVLTNEVGRAWMQKDPEKGANWLIETATDANRSARINEVVTNWLGQDPNAAAKWLAKFEPSLEIDDALISLSTNIIKRDGEASFEWAARITDENKRDRALGRSFQHWYFYEPEDAEAHLRSSNVPPDQATEWLEAVETRIQKMESRGGRIGG